MRFAQRFSLFLAPSVLATAVSLMMVPITTYVLGPEAFGVYGLTVSITAMGWGLSLIGSSAVCCAHFPLLGTAERQRLVSSMLFVALAVAALFCLGVAAGWPLVARYADGYSAVPASGLTLSLMAVMLGVPWMVAQDVITLDGRAKGFALTTMAQTVVTSLVTVACLYVWKLGVLALFISAVAGAAVYFIGAIVLLRAYLVPRISGKWVRQIFAVGPASAAVTVTEAVQTNIERGVIASIAGIGALGLYVHAQNYRVLVAQVLKAAARPIWPVSLIEAREADASFRRTRTVWAAVYLGLSVVGITFAMFGPEIIGALTHDRFVDAAPIATFFMVFLLVQNAGKPQTAVLYRDGAVRGFYWIQAASSIVWVLLLIVFVRSVGVIGAVLALMAQALVVRVGVQVLARRRGPSPMTDGWLLGGIVMIVAAWFIGDRLPDSVMVKAIAWGLMTGGILAAGGPLIKLFVVDHLSSVPGFKRLDGLWASTRW